MKKLQMFSIIQELNECYLNFDDLYNQNIH